MRGTLPYCSLSQSKHLSVMLIMELRNWQFSKGNRHLNVPFDVCCHQILTQVINITYSLNVFQKKWHLWKETHKKQIPFNDKSKPFSHLFFSERNKFYFSVALTSYVGAEQRKGKGLNKILTSNQKEGKVAS